MTYYSKCYAASIELNSELRDCSCLFINQARTQDIFRRRRRLDFLIQLLHVHEARGIFKIPSPLETLLSPQVEVGISPLYPPPSCVRVCMSGCSCYFKRELVFLLRPSHKIALPLCICLRCKASLYQNFSFTLVICPSIPPFLSPYVSQASGMFRICTFFWL